MTRTATTSLHYAEPSAFRSGFDRAEGGLAKAHFSPLLRLSSSVGARPAAAAFTLIELLLVLGLIILLMAFIVPNVAGPLNASRLTSAGDTLLLKVSQARQIAMTANRATEIRFYSYTDESSEKEGVRAYQLFYREASAAESEPIEEAVHLGRMNIIAEPGELSPLITPQNWISQSPKPVSTEPWRSRGATYLAVVFEPDGSTNIPLSLHDSFITLLPETGANTADSPGGTPLNYYTIQIDPVNGRASAYRP